jgi:membrane protein implicated in regulation of membrane protease activity
VVAVAVSFLPGGFPHDLDDESIRALARSFYVVKMARYAGLLVATLLIGALAVARDAPGWVAWAMVVLVVVFVVVMALTRRRYVSSRRPPAAGPSSSSPTG